MIDELKGGGDVQSMYPIILSPRGLGKLRKKGCNRSVCTHQCENYEKCREEWFK